MTTQALKRKLAAVLHTDVKGYSRLMTLDEEGTVRTLAAYREVLVKLVMLHNGRMVDTAGDGFLVEFPSVVDAVACAVEFQQEIKERNEQLPSDRAMEFRVGINVGDVIEDSDQIFGNGVNIAARLQALAEPGEIFISGTAYDHLKRKLALGYEYLGQRTVKNIIDPVRIYKVRTDSKRTSAVGGEPKESRLSTGRWAALAVLSLIAVVAISLAVSRHYAPPRGSQSRVLDRTHPVAKPEAAEPQAGAGKKKPDEPKAEAIDLPDGPSVAVLPFANLSGDPNQEYFSDGMTVEIIRELGKIPNLLVIAPGSTFTFKKRQKDAKSVAREVGVRFLLGGGVRKARDRVTIRAFMVDTKSAQEVWVEQFERDLKEITVLHQEMLTKILAALNVKHAEGTGAPEAKKSSETSSVQAYDKFLQGLVHLRQRQRHENVRARQLFEDAIAVDPNYARAYAAMAQTYILEARRGWAGFPLVTWRTAHKLTEKALSLDDSLDLALMNMAVINLQRRLYDEAVALGKRAVLLNPGSAEANFVLGTVLIFSDRPGEAIAALNRAIRLNPKSPVSYLNALGDAYRGAKRHDEAITAYKKALQLSPENADALTGLTVTYQLAGNAQGARSAAGRLMKDHPTFSLTSLARRLPYKNPGETLEIVGALRQAGLK